MPLNWSEDSWWAGPESSSRPRLLLLGVLLAAGVVSGTVAYLVLDAPDPARVDTKLPYNTLHCGDGEEAGGSFDLYLFTEDDARAFLERLCALADETSAYEQVTARWQH